MNAHHISHVPRPSTFLERRKQQQNWRDPDKNSMVSVLHQTIVANRKTRDFTVLKHLLERAQMSELRASQSKAALAVVMAIGKFGSSGFNSHTSPTDAKGSMLFAWHCLAVQTPLVAFLSVSLDCFFCFPPFSFDIQILMWRRSLRELVTLTTQDQQQSAATSYSASKELKALERLVFEEHVVDKEFAPVSPEACFADIRTLLSAMLRRPLISAADVARADAVITGIKIPSYSLAWQEVHNDGNMYEHVLHLWFWTWHSLPKAAAKVTEILVSCTAT